MSIDADVIMPICATNYSTFNLSNTAIRTCRASTSARMLVMGNNIPRPEWREYFATECRLLGIEWVYIDGPFSLSGFWNDGALRTAGQGNPTGYVAYCGADAIYYPNWLECLIELWEEDPSFFVVVPYSFDFRGMPCERDNPTPKRVIVQTGNPAGAVQVFHRRSKWKWDEQFPMWEMDADLLYYLEANNLKGGICYNSRVDHLVQGFSQEIDLGKHYGVNDIFHTAKERVKAKWASIYKG